MREAGLNPRLLNLGGGYPVRYVKPIPAIEIIAEVINEAIADLPETIRIMAEPGRYLVSDSACLYVVLLEQRCAMANAGCIGMRVFSVALSK